MTGEEKLAAVLREARQVGECSPAVEERLRVAFRQRRARPKWPIWAIAAAAALIAVWFWYPKPQITPAIAPPRVAAVDPPRLPLPAIEAPPPAVPRRVRRPRPAREVATEFYALDPASVDESLSGYVMRVRVPRPTMASFGLPVNMDLADQRVDADVLVGNDGTARAIRFVRTIQ